MARDWEFTFRQWAKPPGKTEQEKCNNAERMIREAISEHQPLSGREVDVFAQGSYRNNTNVGTESDVDICVHCRCSFFYDSDDPGLTPEAAGFSVPAQYRYDQFKKDVENALVAKFGPCGVTPGKKAFDVHENTYRVDADAVAWFEYRQYYWDQYRGCWRYRPGVKLLSSSRQPIINFPEQHYESGTRKNAATGKRFKFVTRALKGIRNEMEASAIAVAKQIPSFLIECLVWNVPDADFGNDLYADDIRNVLARAHDATLTDEGCADWLEVNECKYLFRSSQPWTRAQANDFIYAAWDYLEFE